MRKKIFVLVLVLIVLLIVIKYKNNKELFVFSSYEGFLVEGDTIIKYNNYGGNVIIPRTIDGVEIKRIGDYAFSNLEIESVLIPDSIVEIGDYAFSNNNLKYITFPNSVVKIGEGSFIHNQIEKIDFNSNIDFGYACFNDNYLSTNDAFFFSLTNEFELISYGGKIKGNIVLPSYTEIIGEKAFMDSGIISITIHDNVYSIRSGAFKGNNLVEVYLSDNVKEIAIDAFSNNDYLMEIFVNNYENSIVNDPWGADFSTVFWTKK